MYMIHLTGTNPREFNCNAETNLLTAARRQFIPIPLGCCNGGCGMCKIKVIEGEYKRGLCSKTVLTDEEREAQYSLACKTYPQSNLTITLDLD